MGGRKRRRVIYAICPKATRTTSACRPELERCPDGIGRARRDGGSDWVGRRVTKRGRPSSRQDVGRGPKAEHDEADQEMGPPDGARTTGDTDNSTLHRPGQGGSMGERQEGGRGGRKVDR